jgi:hypothetical protein
MLEAGSLQDARQRRALDPDLRILLDVPGVQVGLGCPWCVERARVSSSAWKLDLRASQGCRPHYM